MKEKLSALIDGELCGEDLHAQLGWLKTDAELRRVWDTYHLIGDALRGHLSPDFSVRVAARLFHEPILVAPQRATALFRRIAWYAVSAAAGVAAVAMVVWTALPNMHSQAQIGAGSAVAVPAITVTAATPGVPVTEAGPRLTAAEVENYLLAHQPYSHTSTLQGVAPYVRTVSDEREAEKK
jgi:sigma-E factor negative regulatory protein RseA